MSAKYIIETSYGIRTLVELEAGDSLVTPMIDAFNRGVADDLTPSEVSARPLANTQARPFIMRAGEITAEDARRKALR